MHKILVIGTGTIGQPLIGLLADFSRAIDVDVFFHKRTPLLEEVAKVNRMINRGAKLVVNKGHVDAFQTLGHAVVLEGLERAIEQSDVIIDCTPAGNKNRLLYEKYAHGKDAFSPQGMHRRFIAQGSEKGFGTPYAYNIVPYSTVKDSTFIQVVSCNTHTIAALIHALAPNLIDLYHGDFTCIRRANDISQDNDFIAGPVVGKHDNSRYGTHHAADVVRLFDRDIPIFSSAMKINSQYMHTIRFNMIIKRDRGHDQTPDNIIALLQKNPLIGLTHRNSTNRVFSFGRDEGYYGRILNQAVVSTPSLHVRNIVYNNKAAAMVTGFCFTPQDGNSLLSSIAAALIATKGSKFKNYIDSVYSDMVFQTI